MAGAVFLHFEVAFVTLAQRARPRTVVPSTPPRADREALVVQAARALHQGGLPADRLENAVQALAQRFDLEVQVFAAPTELQLSFGDERQPRGHLLRVEPGQVDLGRMVRLQQWMEAVPRTRPDLVSARRALVHLSSLPPTFGPLAVTAAFTVAAASAACFFGGTWFEVGVSAVFSLALSFLSRWSARSPESRSLFEPLAAFLVSFGARAFAHRFGGDAATITLGSLIVLVPGFTLTVAIRELATRHLLSGTARLASAAMTFLGLGFGVAFGQVLADRWLGARGTEMLSILPELPAYASTVALALSPLAFGVLFQARKRDLWIIAPVCWAGFYGARFGSEALGPQLGVWLGALVVGVAGNLGSRLLRLPAALTATPGIMLLVPGSIGFRSVSMLLAADVVSGVEAAFHMIIVAVSLVGGLLCANVFLPPRRSF